jgi:hypothetical protein
MYYQELHKRRCAGIIKAKVRAVLRQTEQWPTVELVWQRLPKWLRDEITPAYIAREYPQLARHQLSDTKQKELAGGKFYISPGTLSRPPSLEHMHWKKPKHHQDPALRSSVEQQRKARKERYARALISRALVAEGIEKAKLRREIARLSKQMSLENVVWDDMDKRKPIDKAAVMELIYTSVAEPHYEPHK